MFSLRINFFDHYKLLSLSSLCFLPESTVLSVHLYQGLPWWLSRQESACSAGASGGSSSTPGLGRSPGGGQGNPLQCSCLENPSDRGAWWTTDQRLQRVEHNWTSLACMQMHLQQFILDGSCVVSSMVFNL